MSELLEHARQRRRTWEQVAMVTAYPRYPMVMWAMAFGVPWVAGCVVIAVCVEAYTRAANMPSFIAQWGL